MESLIKIRHRPEGRSHNQLQVWASALEAIEKLSHEIPTIYHLELAEAAAKAGSILWRLGNRIIAKRAFELAYHLGPPKFNERNKSFRLLARILGPFYAEYLGIIYHSLRRII